MDSKQKEAAEILIRKGKEFLNRPYRKIEFTGNPVADELLNDIESFPHAFVLACIMDRQIKAERAWLIPYKISIEIGGFEFSRLLEMEQNQIKEIFSRKHLHRFYNIMAENFYQGVQKIHRDYDDDASNIWKGNPESITIVEKFLKFKGVEKKIANMAANILARDFKIPMANYTGINISPDIHVKRVFKRLGFISQNASNDELIQSARELNPEYPGIFDLPCWEIGRNWCKPKEPDCMSCYLEPYCPKKI